MSDRNKSVIFLLILLHYDAKFTLNLLHKGKILVKRLLFNEIKDWLKEDKIIIIKGARRTGKTTLLGQIKNYLRSAGWDVIYFSVDQELDNPIFSHPKYLLRFLKDQYGVSEKKRTYVLLDECQYLKSVGLFLKVLYDMAHHYLTLIVTGSSSLELSQNREFLTGRKIEFVLNRFSFIEYLWGVSDYKYNEFFELSLKFNNLKEFYEVYKNDLEFHFINYSNWGGYPEVCLQKEEKKKTILLREIVRTYIQKDVANFFKIGNISAFNHLIIILSHQIGNLLNKTEVCDTLNLHFKTLESYLDILQGTFIFAFVRPFYTNIRKELSKMPKVYVEDLGIVRYAMGRNFTNYHMIDGNIVENFVYNHLALSFPSEDIHFYRTISKSEVDFIIKNGNRLIPIEVKFRKMVSIPVSMRNFGKKYAQKLGFNVIITQTKLDFYNNTYFIPAVLFPFVKWK